MCFNDDDVLILYTLILNIYILYTMQSIYPTYTIPYQSIINTYIPFYNLSYKMLL